MIDKGGSWLAMRFFLGHLWASPKDAFMLQGFLPRPSRSPSIADIVAKTCFDVSDLVFSHSQVATLLFPMSQSARLSVGCQEECLADEQRVGSDSVLVWASGQWLLCRAI
ncbi:hypothetical protein F4825DRAFT_322163 [Nemania diffusa]|nr:hypothetical protein F4825DRAFT_322163 [Nemania diffusa]